MENKSSTERDRQKRSIVDRIWNPVTNNDQHLVRIFFWASIIICLFLENILEGLANNRVWDVISAAWLAFAVFVRFKVYIKW